MTASLSPPLLSLKLLGLNGGSQTLSLSLPLSLSLSLSLSLANGGLVRVRGEGGAEGGRDQGSLHKRKDYNLKTKQEKKTTSASI